MIQNWWFAHKILFKFEKYRNNKGFFNRKILNLRSISYLIFVKTKNFLLLLQKAFKFLFLVWKIYIFLIVFKFNRKDYCQ